MKATRLSIITNACLTAAVALLALAAVSFLAGQAYAQEEGTIEIDTSPEMVPVLSIIHDNTLLVASATDNNLDADSWQYAGPLDYEPDCEFDNLSYSLASASANRRTLTEDDNGKWYCFKVGDGDGNSGFAEYQVTGVVIEREPARPEPVAQPEVTVNQEGDILQASTEESLISPVWQALFVESSTDCSAAAFARADAERIAGTSRITGLTPQDNGRIYCFRVSDSGQSHGYDSIVISGVTVPATATPISLPAPTPSTPQVSTPVRAPAPSPQHENGDEEDADDTDPEDEDTDEADGDKNEDKDDEEGGDNDNLRLVGVAIVVAGIMALIGVLIFSRKQSGSDDGDIEDEEL